MIRGRDVTVFFVSPLACGYVTPMRNRSASARTDMLYVCGIHKSICLASVDYVTVDLIPLLACRYVEAMRKRKLQGGKQDIAGAKEDVDSRTKDWKVDLTAASRALALRWLRAARERLEGEHS